MGTRGGERSDVLCDTFLCLQSKSFVDTSIFYFGISNSFVIAKEQFQKNFFHRGIELIVQKQIRKIWIF